MQARSAYQLDRPGNLVQAHQRRTYDRIKHNPQDNYNIAADGNEHKMLFDYHCNIAQKHPPYRRDTRYKDQRWEQSSYAAALHRRRQNTVGAPLTEQIQEQIRK